MHKAAKLIRTKLSSVGRPQIVWASLLAAMTGVGGLLLALEDRPMSGGVVLAGVERQAPAHSLNAILNTTTPIAPDRWHGIVIHHSGSQSGSATSIADQHLSRGFKGLGYHFVISNGQGAPDGQIHVGYRWMEQAPGVHATGPDADRLNRETIGICLIGDGDRRAFTPAQLASLASLVAMLQSATHVDSGGVYLSRDVSPTSAPGRLFPESAFRQQLAASH
jgi:N-acetyl-anhydromuramyl-L-alanine amidase AmpD